MSKKVSKAFRNDNELYVEFNGNLIIARPVDGYLTRSINEYTGEEEVDYVEAYYEIASFNGYGKLYGETFETIDALAEGMREMADLRTWKLLYTADGEPRA